MGKMPRPRKDMGMDGQVTMMKGAVVRLTRGLGVLVLAGALLAAGCKTPAPAPRGDDGRVAHRVGLTDDELEIVMLTPDSPAALKPGDHVNVTMYYRLNTTEKAMVWARPYTQGQLSPDYYAMHLLWVDKQTAPSGVVQRDFYCNAAKCME